MAILTTRDSTDPNASADINTLSSRAVDVNTVNAKGDIYVATADNTVTRLGVGSNDTVLMADSTQSEGVKWGGGSPFVLDMPAGSWDYPATNFAPWEKVTGTYGDIYAHAFDDGGAEYVQSQFKLPENIGSGSTTVTFYIEGFAKTWVTGKNVEFTFYHSAKADDEDWDSADFTSEVSGDLALSTTAQDSMDFFSYTETFTNLGWSAGDHVRIKLGRTAASANELSGDYYLTHFRISVPRA
jgi:hypothetical protein